MNNLKEEVLQFINNLKYTPKTFDELVLVFEVSNKCEFKKLLDLLIDNNEIFYNNKKNRYLSKRQAKIYKGYISIRNINFGFVNNEFYPDFYVAAKDFETAIDNDYVLYKIEDDAYETKAYVLKVLERKHQFLVGTIAFKNNKYILIHNENISKIVYIEGNDLKVNDIVRVKIEEYKKDFLKTKVIDILGDINTPDIKMLKILAINNIETKFSDDVLEYTNSINIDINPNRKRFHDKKIYTIDGLDAKDLDDAISVELLDNGNYELGVYIADVSYYVEVNSILDIEALKRGTSIYLIDRVIPMLPQRLSNDLCSLNPNQDKLVIALIMEIDSKGIVVEKKFYESVIKTSKRLSYEDCNKAFENVFIDSDYDKILPNLELMRNLSEIIRNKRFQKGSIDFDIDEAKIIVDSEGKVLDVLKKDRGISERIIEDFMIMANETVASFIEELGLPFIYRVHDKIDEVKFMLLKNIVKGLGYNVISSHPKEIQKLMNNLSEQDEYIKTTLLRHMAKAVYSDINIGHYGLASNSYTHFTSPIRRYPDLIVHRLIRNYLFENKLVNFLDLNKIASRSSKAERKAIEVEYLVLDIKKAEYIANFINSKFTGIVTSILKKGIYVTLENTIDGLIPSDNLFGFSYNQKNNNYYSQNKTIKLGDKIEVIVASANEQTGKVTFKYVYNGVKNGKYKNHFKK